MERFMILIFLSKTIPILRLLHEQTWLQMRDFAEGTILLVLSDSLYNEDDYVRNYDEFIEGLQGI